MTFRFSKGPIHEVDEGQSNFYMYGCAYGRLKICVEIPRGRKSRQQVDVTLTAETISAVNASTP